MTYNATAGTMGNSKGIRIEAALFREHTEFASGPFQVDVIAPGRLLVRAPVSSDEALDPVLDAFLGFLEAQMSAHPEGLAPLRMSEARRAHELIGGVEVSDDEVFDESFQLP